MNGLNLVFTSADGRVRRRRRDATNRAHLTIVAGASGAPNQKLDASSASLRSPTNSLRNATGGERFDVLLVEDSPSDAWLVDQQLRECGDLMHVTTVTNLAEALNATQFRHFDAALLDLNLPDSQGLTTFDSLHAAAPDLPLIVLSGVANADVALAVLRRGAQDCVLKSEVPGALLDRVVRLAIERLRMTRELDRRMKELKQNEMRILKIIEESREAFIVIDAEGIVKFANDGALAMLELFPGRLIGQRLPWTAPAEGFVDVAIRRADGSPGIGELASVGQTTVQTTASVAGSLLSLRDVTDRRRAAAAVRDSEFRLRALLEHCVDSILLIDVNGLVEYASPSVEKVTGYSTAELLGIDGFAFLFADEMEKYAEFVDDVRSTPQKSRTIQWQFRHKLGQSLHLDGIATNLLDSPYVRGIVINFSDVTQRKRTEEAQRQSQKMEALGTLAGGIAHDFNNILLAIAGNARLALTEADTKPSIRHSLLEIDKASRRAANLVRRILSFSRRDIAQREVVDLRTVIAEAMELLKSTLPASINLHIQANNNAPCVLADATQVHQVLLNLATNALHAIAERGNDQSGTISIGLEEVVLDSDSASAIGEIPAGRYARLSVVDDGCGIDPSLLSRIFEPFFTTKPKGQGTGLGLSVVHGIMREHEGTITATSVQGKGSTFRLFFPVTSRAVEKEKRPQLHESVGQGERILYVDDEEALVFLAHRVLTKQGYRVETFTDPAKALEAFKQDSSQFDAVVTDLSMIGMSGFQLAQAIRAVHPTIPIVLTSGHVSPEDRDRAAAIGLDDLILKPNTIDELSTVLHDCLQRKFKKR